MQKHDTVTPEQVVEVPQLSHDSIPQRSALRRPQKAEQLVEVPTEPAYVLAVTAVQAMAKQIVDNPVPQGRRGGGVAEVFKVYAQDRIQQRFVEQSTLTFQFLQVVAQREVFKVFAEDRVHQLLHQWIVLVLVMELLIGFFRTFPGVKKSAGSTS